MGLFMMSQAFPQAILLLSIYALMQKLGLLGSYYALMISYVVFTLPVGTWTLKTLTSCGALAHQRQDRRREISASWWKIIFPWRCPA